MGHMTMLAQGLQAMLNFKRNLIYSFLNVCLHGMGQIKSFCDIIAVLDILLNTIWLVYAKRNILCAFLCRQLVRSLLT
ncbi:hypothetical protein D3C76_1726130 [compost metagenome]